MELHHGELLKWGGGAGTEKLSPNPMNYLFELILKIWLHFECWLKSESRGGGREGFGGGGVAEAKKIFLHPIE